MMNIRFLDALKVALAFGLVTIGIYFVYSIGDIIVMFLVAFLFAIALNKPLDKLVCRGFKRHNAVIVIYSTFFTLVIYAIYLFLPAFAQELRELVTNIPAYIQNTSIGSLGNESKGALTYLSNLADSIISGSQTLTGIIFKISDGFVTFLIVFFLSLFINLPKEGAKQFITSFVPKKHRSYASDLFTRIESKVGLWLWGKSVSSLFVAIFIFLGLLIIGIEYAITFAILAAFLNFVPFIGPFIASLFPLVLGLLISPAHAFAVAILYLVVNSIENFILIPLLMKHSINLNPVLLVLIVLIGGKIGGILGILIAIPIAAILTLVYEEYAAMFAQKERDQSVRD